MKGKKGEKGGVLVEFIIAMSIMVFAFHTLGGLIMKTKHHVQCLSQIFYITHLYSTGKLPKKNPYGVIVFEEEDRYVGKAQCPFNVQTFELPKLEYAKW
jgi:hypothetical protein